MQAHRWMMQVHRTCRYGPCMKPHLCRAIQASVILLILVLSKGELGPGSELRLFLLAQPLLLH